MIQVDETRGEAGESLTSFSGRDGKDGRRIRLREESCTHDASVGQSQDTEISRGNRNGREK